MFRLRIVASTARRCGPLRRAISGEVLGEVLHTFPFSIQPESVSDYNRFEQSIVEAIAEDMDMRPDSVGFDRITEAARSLRRVRRALERVEDRRAKGADVGLRTSLYPTRDLPGSAFGEIETGVAWREPFPSQRPLT